MSDTMRAFIRRANSTFHYSPLYCALIFGIPVQAQQHNTQDKDVEVLEVLGRKNQANTEVTEQTEKLLNVAGVMGDPLSAVFSLPSVVYAGGDDGGEPAVRGSSPDDNAFYIDNMPVSYIFHMFGDSIFNENLIRDFNLQAAAFDSPYGNATGGIFDVKLRDPRNQDIQTTLEASMLKTGVFVEGGVSEDQAFYLSYRRSLVHLFIDVEEDEGEKLLKAPLSDDYQGKYQWLIGNDQKLTFTMAGASDLGAINLAPGSEEGLANPDSIGENSINNAFNSQSLAWQYFADDNSIFEVSLGNNQQSIKQKFGTGQFANLKQQQQNLRLQYQTQILPRHTLMTGLDWQRKSYDYNYDFIPEFCTDNTPDCESNKGVRTRDRQKLSAGNVAFYLHDKWELGKAWLLDLGLRLERDDYTNESFVHPRLGVSWYATDDLNFSAKVGRYSRFPDVTKTFPQIGNPKLKSPVADHFVLSSHYQINDLWSTSVELYHKNLKQLPREVTPDADNAELRFTNDVKGQAQGMEWLLTRELSDGWYGWASVSWSKSERTDKITGVTTEYYLDTPLLANLVVNYQWNDNWEFGLRYTVRSGQKYTPITGIRPNPNHAGHFLPNNGALNSKTLPAYSRLDLQATYKTTYWGQPAEWNFAVLNALAQDNVSGYEYDPRVDDTLTNFRISEETGLEMFPSIGFKISF